MRVAVMIEGQEGQTWDDWVHLARTAERLGFEALFRSDHYLSVDGMDERGALDAWGTVCGLAAVTETLRLGTLVSPATFRHPSVLAKLAVTADHISGGRVELGVGTGWHEPEHRAYGFAFPPLRTRMDRLAEQVAIIRGSWGEGPFDLAGEHYTVAGLDARPKPVQSPHLPLVMGGSAGPRGARLAARYATEYNVVHVGVEEARAARGRLDAACEAEGRDPATLRFSLMHSFLVGSDDADLRRRTAELARWQGVSEEQAAAAGFRGTPDAIVEQARAYADAGIERVMLQHHLFRDDAALELLAADVVPALGAG